MSRGSSMSGANNIPLGPRGGVRDGALAQAAASLSGTSLLNPEYLQAGGGGGSQASSGGSSKFGPIASKYLYPFSDLKKYIFTLKINQSQDQSEQNKVINLTKCFDK